MPPPPGHNHTLGFLAQLSARGIRFVLRGNKLYVQPPEAYHRLTDEEHGFLRRHRQDVKAVLRDGPPDLPSPPAPVAPDPDPVLYVHGRRVTPADVIAALKQLGDRAVEDYTTGRLSKADAFDIARHRLQQHGDIADSHLDASLMLWLVNQRSI